MALDLYIRDFDGEIEVRIVLMFRFYTVEEF